MFVTDGTVVALDFKAVLPVFDNKQSGVTFVATGEEMEVDLATVALIFVAND